MRISRWLGTAVAVLGLSLTPSAPVLAQGTTTGAIAGTVSDSKKAPIANAQIEVVNKSNGARTGAITRDNGRYFVPNLEVGQYTVNVRRIGYKQYTAPAVTVSLTQTTRLDIDLEDQVAQLAGVTTRAAAARPTSPPPALARRRSSRTRSRAASPRSTVTSRTLRATRRR